MEVDLPATKGETTEEPVTATYQVQQAQAAGSETLFETNRARSVDGWQRWNTRNRFDSGWDLKPTMSCHRSLTSPLQAQARDSASRSRTPTPVQRASPNSTKTVPFPFRPNLKKVDSLFDQNRTLSFSTKTKMYTINIKK